MDSRYQNPGGISTKAEYRSPVRALVSTLINSDTRFISATRIITRAVKSTLTEWLLILSNTKGHPNYVDVIH